MKEIALKSKKSPSDSWKKILNPKPRLTEREARAMLRIVVEIRSESGYRYTSYKIPQKEHEA